MSLYHIHPETGDPGKCRSILGRCPFSGGPEDHYPTAEAARAAFESGWDPFFPPQKMTDEEADAIVHGDDVDAKVKLASATAWEDLHFSAKAELRLDPNPEVQAAIAANDEYNKALEKELEESGVEQWMRGEFHSEASPASQKDFRDSVEQAVASLPSRMGVSMNDSLSSPRINAWIAVKGKLAATHRDSSEGMLEVAKEIETQRNRLGVLHQEQDLNTRKGRTVAATYETMVRAMDGVLDSIQFNKLDKDPDRDANAQYGWLAATPFKKPKVEELYAVPCDGEHKIRVANTGFCRKCGGV